MEQRETVRWVPVPVPEDMILDVMNYVLQRVGQLRTPKIAVPPPEDAYHGGWTEDELRDALKNPTRAMGKVFRYLAARPDEWVQAPVLAKEVYGEGASSNKLGGALGSFTKRVHRRYSKTSWPFEARLNQDTKVWEYCMDARTAEVIRRILGL